MDTLCYNGSVYAAPDNSPDFASLGEKPYFYPRMTTCAHRLLHPQTHLEILNQLLNVTYGQTLRLSPAALQQQTQQLLAANHYPKQGNCVTLCVYPSERHLPPEYLLVCSGQLYYPSYTVWHKRLMLTVMPCEYWFMGYPTGVSRQIARYSRTVAEQAGCDRAVIENMHGILTLVEDEPLFLVHNSQVFTSPIEEGVTDSVMRRLVKAACREEKLDFQEIPLTREMLLACDEAFSASPQGLISFEGYEQARYYNLIANRLAPRLNTLELP